MGNVQAMNIAYYCQHVLGVGHFHRSLEICRELARKNRVAMITGGAPLDFNEKNVSFFQLPGLAMDSDFKNLSPWDTTYSLAETKEMRLTRLWKFLTTFKPDIFLVELYPFGRKSFRFELDPILEGIRRGQFGNCYSFSSVRDILVERHNREKFEDRVVTTLNSLFDGVLIHGDEEFIPLEKTFTRLADIIIPKAYTGYVTPRPEPSDRSYFRKKIHVLPTTDLIVASIGGGGVGSELLFALVAAMELLENENIKLHIFTGPYTNEDVFENLAASTDKRITVSRFDSDFHRWLAAADVSVSMAGYNTTMNVLAVGCPALFYPFRQNQEQLMRVTELAKSLPIKVLSEADLKPELLIKHLQYQLRQKSFHSPIRLDGAERTAAQVRQWCDIRKS